MTSEALAAAYWRRERHRFPEAVRDVYDGSGLTLVDLQCLELAEYLTLAKGLKKAESARATLQILRARQRHLKKLTALVLLAQKVAA